MGDNDQIELRDQESEGKFSIVDSQFGPIFPNIMHDETNATFLIEICRDLTEINAI